MATAIQTTKDDAYLHLVRSFPLRPIRSAAAHQRAKTRLRSLFGKRGAAVRDYKTVLLSLIVNYERSAGLQMDTSKVTAADIVKHLLEERDMSVSAFSKLIEISQSSLSEMLNGKRDWSKSAIIRIGAYFGLEPSIFLR